METFTPPFWLNVTQFAWLMILTAAAYLRKPGQDAALKNEQLHAQVAEQDVRNAAEMALLRSKCELLQSEIRHLPTHGDIRSLIEGMADVKGKLSSVSQGQQAQQHTLQLIQEYMNRSR